MRLLTPKTCQHLAGAFGLVAVVLFAPIECAAQARGFVSVNGGFQATSNDFTEGITFLSNGEDASATTTHGVDAGGLLDVSGGVFVTEQFAIGAGFSRYDKDSDAAVSANLPHPFFFNLDRLVDGTQPAGRAENVVHIQAQWFIPVSDRLEVGVFGGPSLFSVDQEFVRGVDFRDVFPFDTATFVSAPTERQSASAVGFNVGADVTVLLTPNVGVGGLVRFSRATVDMAAPDGTTRSLDAGGVQAGGGLRLRF